MQKKFSRHVCRAATRKVGLFVDCFTGFGESSLAMAAVRVLESFGYQVVLLDAGCCGRPAISVGMLAHARRNIERTVPALLGAQEGDGIDAVIMLEPSCLSSMRDDLQILHSSLTVQQRKRIGADCLSIEEFLLRRWEQHPILPEFSDSNREILYHGHCHQKALWGQEDAALLFTERLNANCTILETGCCGMAGSFGYMHKTEPLSREIARRDLVAKINLSPDACIIAPGTSCRHQVRDCTEREALHPVQLLDQLVKHAGE